MRRLGIVVAAVMVCAQSCVSAAQTPVIDIVAGREQGMSVITIAGDGKVKDTVLGDRKCIEVDRTAGSSFIYVNVGDGFRPAPDTYVTIDYYDQSGEIDVDYDAGASASAYRRSPDSIKQTKTLQWRTATLLLRKPQFQGRENGDADFRLYTSGALAVSRIVLSTERPDGYAPPADPSRRLDEREPARVAPGMTVIQQWQIHEPVVEGQLNDSAYEVAKKIGITSLQSYVGWAQLEPEQGRFDFSMYDPVVSQIRKHQLKWLPFLILGPRITVPKWFRAESGVDAVCLEHGETTPIQSIWNPNLRKGVRRFLEVFRSHYQPDVIEALNFGISGNWGESIMPVGGGFDMEGRHTHGGWWCGDKYARADLRRWVEAKYHTVGALNSAWRTNYASFDAVEPFTPSGDRSRRANVDLTDWYMQSMTDLAEYWVKTAREIYPTLPIYLCTGGNGDPMLGADWGAQAKVCAKYGAGIRITNQGDDFLSNFAITRMVSSSTRLYGQYYTTEPGGDNQPEGIAGRVFDAVAGGARGAYFKYLMDTPDVANIRGLNFMDNAKYFVPNKPDLKIAAIMPNSAIALNRSDLDLFLARAGELRDAADFEFIDENMINDGMLKRFKAVVMLAGDTLESPSLDRLKSWVADGGVLFTMGGLSPLRTVEGRPVSWLKSPSLSPDAVGSIYSSAGALGVRVDVGHGDDSVLGGEWNAPEGVASSSEDMDTSYRWTSGNSRLRLPTVAGTDVVLSVRLAVTNALGDRARILINKQPVVSLKSTGGQPAVVEIPVPSQALASGKPIVVTFESPTFVPGPNDPRKLGVQVFGVKLAARNAPPERIVPVNRLGDTIKIDLPNALKLIANKLGKGYTVVWPEGWNSYSRFLAQALHNRTAQWGRIADPLDAEYDGVLASRVGSSVYYLNNTGSVVRKRLAGGKTVTIPPHEILQVPI